MNNLPKIQQFENKNQFIIRQGDLCIFQSYESICAIYNIETRQLTLGRDWDYSRTTMKHLYIFIHDKARIIKATNGEIVYLSNELEEKANKKKFILSLIDNDFICYDDNLR